MNLSTERRNTKSLVILFTLVVTLVICFSSLFGSEAHATQATEPCGCVCSCGCGCEELDQYFEITYDANGGDGGKVVSNIALNENHMVLSDSEAEVSKDGCTLIGWNTSADGSGDLYTYGSSINVTSNMTLYAQWEEVIYWSVIYLPGEGTGGYADEYLSSPYYTIKTGNETDVSNGDKTVEYWRDMYTNREYHPGQEIYLYENLILWPIWSD